MNFLIQVVRTTGVLILLVFLTTPAKCDLINVALNKPSQTSAVQSNFTGSFAVDGDYKTYWGAGSFASESNPHWLVVDLGSSFSVEKITLTGPTQIAGQTQNYNLYRGSTSTSLSPGRRTERS
jgi:hypothetical protein